MPRPTLLTVDLKALQHNYDQVKKIAPNCSIMAMVKGNAYGHGIEKIGLALKEAQAFGVASLDEGLQLRAVGIQNPIVLMEGLFSDTEIEEVVQQKFTLIIHHMDHVTILEKNKLSESIPVWIKINTGMNRLGFSPQEAAKIYARLSLCPNVKKPIGLMTHLASADELHNDQTLQQIELFNQATAKLEGPKCVANSAGIIAWPATHLDWVRPGIMLYGASPFANQRGVEFNLKPVMTLTSQLIAVHSVVKGSAIGYGGTWTSSQPTRIGIVAIGYGDGYPRHAANGTPVLINNRPCPLAGRVAMDMIAVDLSSQPEAKVGDVATLWGHGLPVEIIADHSGTSCYELLTRITQRVKVHVLK